MRKLTMITAMALAAIAFGSMTATAVAGEGVSADDSDTGQPCPEVYESDGEVTGGCLIVDYDGSFELGIFLPQWATIGQYGTTFDLAVNANGDGYVVNPAVPWHDGGVARTPCDETDGTPLPWAVESRVVNFVEVRMDITVGLRPSSYQPGTFCTQQTITVEPDRYDLTQDGQSANIKDGYWETEETETSDNQLRIEAQ